MDVKEKFLWDYEFSPEERKGEMFKRWYFTRVLTRGNLEEVRGLGFNAIREMLPHLFLPHKVRNFWDFYFSGPSEK